MRKMFQGGDQLILNGNYLFFKTVTLENEVSNIYVEPNIVANFMARVLQFMYLSKTYLSKNLQ